MIRLPLMPLLARSISAVPDVCRASAEFSRPADVLADVLAVDCEAVEDPLEVEPDELPVAELDEVELVAEAEFVDPFDEAAVGLKSVLPTPKPTFAASAPPIKRVCDEFLPLMSSLPLGSSQAAICALP